MLFFLAGILYIFFKSPQKSLASSLWRLVPRSRRQFFVNRWSNCPPPGDSGLAWAGHPPGQCAALPGGILWVRPGGAAVWGGVCFAQVGRPPSKKNTPPLPRHPRHHPQRRISGIAVFWEYSAKRFPFRQPWILPTGLWHPIKYHGLPKMGKTMPRFP